eukprot:Clim_evm97s153 gene=Clim_evmTU97s153
MLPLLVRPYVGRITPGTFFVRRYAHGCLTQRAMDTMLSEDHLQFCEKVFSERKRESVTLERQAAVLVPFCKINGVPSVLFTLRSAKLNKHSGEVSFPGGMMDDTDKDLTFTALREMEEELGWDPKNIRILGIDNDAWEITKTASVTPVVGYLGDLDMKSLKLNPDEVEQAFTFPISHLLDPKNVTYNTYRISGKVPRWTGGPEIVWGLTAWLMDRVLKRIINPWIEHVESGGLSPSSKSTTG